jgi:hypothetical protein
VQRASFSFPLYYLILKDYIHNLNREDLQELSLYFTHQLYKIENDIEQLIEDREVLKRLRKYEFSKENLQSELEYLAKSFNFSDGNLVYKMVQRYGYLKILTEIKVNYDEKNVVPSDVDQILSILSK